MEIKNPTHIAFRVDERDGDKKDMWTEVGVAWTHKDGEGMTLQLKAMPIDGKVVILPAKERPEPSDDIKGPF